MQNTNRIKTTAILISIMLFLFYANAQNTNETDTSQTEEIKYKIHVLAKVTAGEIVLRWAPDNAIAWHYANQYGYVVERHTIIRDGKQVIPADMLVLTPNVLKPASEDKWATAEKNKYNAVAWQAVYGESFELIETENEMVRIMDKTNEIINRYSFALFACDHSPQAAELSGLLFRDKKIKKNEKYLYRVYTKIPHEIALIDTGTYFIDAGQITEYPKPLELTAEFNDRIVNLRWNQMYYKGIYTAWSIERSDDSGKTFKRINENPIVNLHAKGREIRHMHYADSLPENDSKYLYRVIGHSPFGDEGPPSDTVSGYGKEVLKANPVLSKTLINEKGEALISWQFPEDFNSELKGFKVSSAPKAKGIFKDIHEDILPPDDRLFLHKTPASTNYYKVTAIDKHGRTYKSQAYLVQLIDSIPPEPPEGLRAYIDSAGIVTVSWNPCPEEDFFGYRVYMTNHMNSEFTQITKKAIKDTVFRFKTTLKTLTENMYLKAMAEDNRFNPSAFSEIIKVMRPDTIPPSPPVIKDFKITDTCIYLKWVKSTSKDVVNHIVFRSLAGKDEWEAIAIFDSEYNRDSHCDTSAVPGILYKYLVIAVDEADNRSKKIKPVNLQMSKKKVEGKINNFKAEIDREAKHIVVSWDLPDEPFKEINLYRRTGEGKIKTYKRFYEAVDKFTDKNIYINTSYEYRLRIIFANGKSSPFSEKVIVDY